MEKQDPTDSGKEASQSKGLNFGSCNWCGSSSTLLISGYCSKCSSKDPRSQGFLGRWNHFYNSFSNKVVHRNQESKDHTTDNSGLDTTFKKVKRSENVFTKIKRFYRSITEDDYQPESDHSEPAEVVLESKLNELEFLNKNGDEKGNRDNLPKDNLKQNKEYERDSSSNRDRKERDRVDKESKTKEGKDNGDQKSNDTMNNGSKECENDFVASFSTLSVQIRNEELDKMHDVLKRYRDKENRLTEKLMKNEYKVQEYDYFPKLGERDHDIWDLKTKLFEDDTMEYMKVLFFRDSEPMRYDLRDIQVSVDRVRESDGILVDKFGIEINTSNISCLMDTNWLNDEIINFYLQILQEQNDLLRSEHDLPSCYFFNTFFFQALCGNDVPGVFYDYKSVARWTKRKKVNIFEKDLLIVPVHVSKVHWALGVVDMRSKWRRIMIFDSLGGTNPTWFKNIRRWLQDEHLDKMKKKLTQIDEWKVPKNYSCEPYAPSQKNSYDCGLFLCQFAKCISFAKGFDFTNESSSYLRNMMIHEILSCKIEV